jgi:hypothetical protein
MKRQVRAIDEQIACDVCGRTMLKGERTEPYLAPSRERKLVCSLCAPRAQQEGWIRETGSPATPALPPREPDRKKRRRIGRRNAGASRTAPSRESEGSDAPSRKSGGPDTQSRKSGGSDAQPNGSDLEPVWSDSEEKPVPAAGPRRRSRLGRDPRHVRAVPTNAQLKLERAIDLFNASEHLRTVTGLSRTLGQPQVSATTSSDSAAEVLLTVAWDISWYQFVVDLSDTRDPVRIENRGQEIDELSEKARAWNGRVEQNGTLAIGPEEGLNGDESEQGL